MPIQYQYSNIEHIDLEKTIRYNTRTQICRENQTLQYQYSSIEHIARVKTILVEYQYFNIKHIARENHTGTIPVLQHQTLILYCR